MNSLSNLCKLLSEKEKKNIELILAKRMKSLSN